jgi:nitrate/nitrite transporter NarK
VTDAPRPAWPLASICLFAWALGTTYTNHAPLIPVFIERLGFTPTEAGHLTLAFFLSTAAISLPAGILSDRLGPKRIASAGLAVACLADGFLGYANTFAILLLLKAIAGFGAGLAFIAGVRYVTVVFPPTRVHLAQGLYGGCVQFGAGTSIYLMPLLYESLNLDGAFVASAGSGVAVLVFWLVLAPDRRVQLPPARFLLAIRNRTVWLLTMAHAGTFGLAMLVGTWIATFMVLDLGLSLSAAGALGSAVLILGILSRPGGGSAIDRGWVLTRTMIRLSLLTGALALAMLAVPGRPIWAALAAVLVLGIVLNMPYSAVMNTATAALPASPGAAIGIVGTVSIVLIALGAPGIGALLELTGSFALVFGLLAAFSLAVFLLTRFLRGEEEFAAEKERLTG